MVDRINDIAWQAHQGSVAAIIQLLNEKLADSGVRTRAIFADGILQLLCEAATAEQLEQSTLVEQIQQILNSIAPRNIRRVNINSRIVREQQLLWLDEINRDRENQLLWSQEIILSKGNIIYQVTQYFTEASIESAKPILPKTKFLLNNKDYYKNPVQQWLLVCAGLLSLILFAWVVDSLFGNTLKSFIPVNISSTEEESEQTTTQVANNSVKTNAVKSGEAATDDYFAAAVRLANQASDAGKTAINPAQWLEIAARWQRASDLMGKVPPSHSRYQEALIRTKLYKEYSETAQKEAEKRKSL
ncbi:hypothetical protein [Richelia sinica]|nr:hypothetical protein [Richelia sinica]MBD2663806.1 hypothetical protein [Richelia sinica FACHB-800]